MTNNQRFNKKR